MFKLFKLLISLVSLFSFIAIFGSGTGWWLG